MKARLIIQKGEIYTGVLLVLAAVIAHANKLFCIVGQEGCGMLEPLIAFWSLLFGSGLLVAGMSFNYTGFRVWLGHAILVFILIFAATIE